MEEDKEVLLSASHQDTPQDAVDALHIFARKVDVNKHNNRMIVLKCNPIITSVARDFDRDQVTGQSREREKPYQQCARDDLQAAIKLGVGARIMLTRNIDTDDGLVNGAFGVITAIDSETPSRVKAVYVKFDSDKVGRQYFKKTSTTDPKKKGSVKIEPVDATLKGKRATRKQLPLRLGYASTIHKVQGMTASNIVVSLKNIHQAGMAYVGLSRATSLQGLHILDFDPDVIFASEGIIDAIQQMPSFLSTDAMQHESQTILTILHHNTEGILPHLPDVQKLKPADVMCFTETWFENGMTIPASLLPDYTPEMLSRGDAFKDYEALSIKLTNRGGVGIFTKESVTGTHEKHIFQSTGLEAVAVKIRQPFRFILTTVYRSQNYPLQQCLPKLREMLNEIQLLDIPSIIVDDFNDNALQLDNCKIIPEVCALGYSQLVNQPTTDSGSCLDLVFVKGLNIEKIKITLQPTYYSVHDSNRISFTS